MVRSSAAIGGHALLTPDALKCLGEIRRCSVSVLEVLVKDASEGHGFSYRRCRTGSQISYRLSGVAPIAQDS
jgi:hypothetical protein